MIGDPFGTIISSPDLFSDAESVYNHVHFFIQKIFSIFVRSNLALADEINDFSPHSTDIAFDKF